MPTAQNASPLRVPLGAKLGCLGAVALVGFIALLVFWAHLSVSVKPGHVGVVQNWGAIDMSQRPYDQGFHWISPFQTDVTEISIQQQNHTFSKVGTGSKELQNVYVTGGVNYKVSQGLIADPSANPGESPRMVYAASWLAIQGGPEVIVKRVFDPAFQDYIKEIVPAYPATEILAHRAQIRDEVQKRLAVKAGPYGLVVDDVFITNIDFDGDYVKAIEAKQVAAQQLEQARIVADTAREKARGEADALAIQADGDARANKLRAQFLTPELIQYLLIAKWKGDLPQVTGGANPFVAITLGGGK